MAKNTMTDEEIKKLAKKIFKSVEDDLHSRKGCGFEGCDDDIIEEIRNTNRERIFHLIKDAMS